MQDPNFSAPRPFDRPSARPNAMPVQRGNYGLPPRRPAPAPVAAPSPVAPAPVVPQSATVKPPMPRPSSGPRMMDVVAPSRPTPPTPIAPVPQESVKQFTPPTPAPIDTPQPVPVAPTTTRQPIFASTPASARVEKPTPRKDRSLLPKLRLALLIVGTVLLLAGALRWVTAGSTSGHIIAVGAVAANNGETMTIQFTADDGQLHKMTADSNEELIPGTSVQVAYRSGAADNSAKQVAPINSAKQLGTSITITGLALLVLGGITTLAMHRRPKHSNVALAQPVTASV